MITVLTWLWKQDKSREHYNAEHVNIWADMVRRNLSMPHRVACVTDHREGIDASIKIIEPPRDFENVRIPNWGPQQPQCLRRLAMFAPNAAERFGERFVSMDLDCVIGGALDPLFDVPEDFRMYKGTGKKRPYNGSMLIMTAGARPQVYTDFTPEGATEATKLFVGSDQAWISHKLGWNEATWSGEHGAMWYGDRLTQDETDWRVMFFPGFPKPWHVPKSDQAGPWIMRNYRRTATKRRAA